jgi:hypothetical protein
MQALISVLQMYISWLNKSEVIAVSDKIYRIRKNIILTKISDKYGNKNFF